MPRPPSIVAARCLCLELLFQRYVLETEDDEAGSAREAARAVWVEREADLGVGDVLTEEERALLARPVGQLSEDELDGLYGRAAGAAILLWALTRTAARPTFAAVEDVVSESGLLGDGSVSSAREAVENATLRETGDLDEAARAYRRLRGKAREVEDAERNFAGIAAHHLAWILDPALAFDDDIALD
jgi:hypothetical protein